jgi:hypothetical protein
MLRVFSRRSDMTLYRVDTNGDDQARLMLYRDGIEERGARDS